MRAVEYTQLSVVHVCQPELMLVIREVRNVVSILVATIQDTIEHNNFLDTVQRAYFRETFPRRFRNDALPAKRVEVSLYGFVRRGKHSIVSASRQQLLQCCLGVRADRYLAKQTYILAIVVLFLKILHDGFPLEYISRRRVDMFRATNQSD